MAKQYRTIRFTYNAITYEIDVRTQDENVTRLENSSIRRTLDGTLYEQYVSTNIKRTFTYTFPLYDEDIHDFFYNAYTAKIAGYSIEMDREEDSGTYETIDVLVSLPVFNDDTVGTTGKIYKGFSCEVLEI